MDCRHMASRPIECRDEINLLLMANHNATRVLWCDFNSFAKAFDDGNSFLKIMVIVFHLPKLLTMVTVSQS